jgi:hypothetical protein
MKTKSPLCKYARYTPSIFIGMDHIRQATRAIEKTLGLMQDGKDASKEYAKPDGKYICLYATDIVAADTTTVRRLNAAMDILSEDPFGHYSIKRLTGELKGSFRLRIGGIRVI